MTRRKCPETHPLARVIALAGTAAWLAFPNHAGAQSSDALINKLVDKGILTSQEADQLKKEAAESETNLVSASKWRLSNAIKDIGLFGDLRFRYEYRGVDNPKSADLTTGDTYRRERFRYALRFGIRGDLYDNFYYGIRLETSTNPRSPWVTFADDSNPTPSAKNSDGIYVGQVYLGWKPTDWYEMTVGRMPMPLYITPMIWDSDINPEGAFEKFKYSPNDKLDLFADFGQFDYENVNPETGSSPSSDTFLLAWQLGANVKFARDMSFKIAPVIYNYVGNGNTNANNGVNLPFTGQGNSVGLNPGVSGFPLNATYNENGINDLLVLEIPAEYNVKIVNPTLGAFNLRLFGDFAYNLDGADRARTAARVGGIPHTYTSDIKAYQVGLGVGSAGPVYGPTQGLVYGSTSKKNTWEARVYWQHIEQYAVDVNLIDSDFFEGRANLEGVYCAVAYSFTDAIIGTIHYGYARRINNNLGTGGNNLDIPQINPINNYNLLQLDLTCRF